MAALLSTLGQGHFFYMHTHTHIFRLTQVTGLLREKKNKRSWKIGSGGLFERDNMNRNKKIQTDGYWQRVRIERTEKIAGKGATVRWRRVRVIYIHLILGSSRVRESVWSPLWCLHLAKALLRERKREERGVCKHTANVQTRIHTRSDKTRFISILYLFSLCRRLFVYRNIPDSKTGIDHSVSSHDWRSEGEADETTLQTTQTWSIGVPIQTMGSMCTFSSHLYYMGFKF